jgi:hypothetical protein
MRNWRALVILPGLLLAPLSTVQADEVHLIIRDGHVDLDAREATVRRILTEWARVGQTRIVNAEGVTGGPVTLQLSNVPEAQALDILLRSVSGYMTAPRPVDVSNASKFDRILVMPTSTPPKAPTTPQPAFQPPQTFGPGGAQPVDDQEDDGPPGAHPMPVPNGRGPVFPQYPNAVPGGPGGRGQGLPQQAPPFVQPVFPPNSYPQVPPFQPQQAPAPVQAPAAGAMPAGVSTPGMVVQPPPQPGQQPGQAPDPRH